MKMQMKSMKRFGDSILSVSGPVNILKVVKLHSIILLLLMLGFAQGISECGTYQHMLAKLPNEFVQCDLCPKGHYVLKDCDHTQKTVCAPCPPHTYNSGCTQAYTCSDCTESCEKSYGEVRTKDCTAINDLECKCPKGMYRAENFFCKNNTRCSPGSGVSKFGTDSSDTECSKCPERHFSDLSDNFKEPCQPWKNCTGDYVTDFPGNETSDRTCKNKTDGQIAGSDGSSSIGIIVGSVVGTLFAILFIAGVVLLVTRRNIRLPCCGDEEQAGAEGVELGLIHDERAGPPTDRTIAQNDPPSNGNIVQNAQDVEPNSPGCQVADPPSNGNIVQNAQDVEPNSPGCQVADPPSNGNIVQNGTSNGTIAQNGQVPRTGNGTVDKFPSFHPTSSGDRFIDVAEYLGDYVLGDDFKKFLGELGFTKGEVQNLVAENSHQICEVVVKGCQKFQKKCPLKATPDHIVHIARQIVARDKERSDLLTYLTEQYKKKESSV